MGAQSVFDVEHKMHIIMMLMLMISIQKLFYSCLNLCEIEGSDTRLFLPDFPLEFRKSQNSAKYPNSKSTPGKFTYIEKKTVVTKILFEEKL